MIYNNEWMNYNRKVNKINIIKENYYQICSYNINYINNKPNNYISNLKMIFSFFLVNSFNFTNFLLFI